MGSRRLRQVSRGCRTVRRAAMRHGCCASPWDHSQAMMLLSALPDASAFAAPALQQSVLAWRTRCIVWQEGEHCRPHTSTTAGQPLHTIDPPRVAQE